MREYDVIIIGAGTAGLTAAIYARRANKRVLVLEGEAFGGQIVFSPKVENYPGILQISGAQFADKLVEQALALGAQVEFERVLGLTRAVDSWCVQGEYAEYCGVSVIIATGLKHRKLGVAREHDIEGVSYCALCDGLFYKAQPVCVVGGGDTALEEALHLAGLCERVYVVHRRESFRAQAYLQEALARCENVTVVMSATVEVLVGEAQLEAVRIRYTQEDRGEDLRVSGLFVAVGQAPQNELFRGIVALDEQGNILAGEDCVTTAPGVFASGDCRTKQVRQLATAAADGAVAAVAACRWVDQARQGGM